LCGWSLRAESIPTQAQTLSLTVAAAAAGSLNATQFTALALVRVDPAAAWPAGTNQVSVTGLAGGNINVDIPGGTTQPVIIQFVPPVPTGGVPNVSVPAIVGGPAYTINIEQVLVSALVVPDYTIARLLDGGQVLGVMESVTGDGRQVWFGEDGIEVGSGVFLNVIRGQVSGCIYVRDIDPTQENA
jgi:hypothetical protein